MNLPKNSNSETLTTHAMDPEKLPMMQVVLMKINGVEYELFGPVISDSHRDIGDLQEITFSELVPLPSVLAYLSSMMANSDPDTRKKMQ